MAKVRCAAFVFLGAVALFSGSAAGDDDYIRKQPEEVYGSQLTTPQERAEHRQKLRSAKTAEERQKLRAEHQQRMRERAKQRGTALPDEPSSAGGGGISR